MDDLIKALQILRKYTGLRWPTYCEHDKFIVCVDPQEVDKVDIEKLSDLGFEADEEEEEFYSFRFGNC